MPTLGRPEAILFDMDGVLVDVRRSYLRAIVETVRHFSSVRVTGAEIAALRGCGGYNNDWDLCEALLRRRGLTPTRSELVAVFQRLYLGGDFEGLMAQESLLVDARLLQVLAGRFKMGIVTGRPRTEALQVLRRFGVGPCFLALVAMEDSPFPKPSPVPVLRALQLLGVASALYVGDTVDDMICGCAAGCVAVGIRGRDRRTVARLRAAGAACILKSASQLPEVLL